MPYCCSSSAPPFWHAATYRLPVTQRPERDEDGSRAARPYRTTTPWVKLAQKCHALAVDDQDGQEMHDASSGLGGSCGRSSPQDFRSMDEQEEGVASEEDDEEEEEVLEDAWLAWEELVSAWLWSSEVRRACNKTSVHQLCQWLIATVQQHLSGNGSQALR